MKTLQSLMFYLLSFPYFSYLADENLQAFPKLPGRRRLDRTKKVYCVIYGDGKIYNLDSSWKNFVSPVTDRTIFTSLGEDHNED